MEAKRGVRWVNGRTVLWSVAGLLALLSAPAVHFYSIEQTLTSRSEGEAQRVELAATSVANVIAEIASTVRVIANFNMVRDFVLDPSPQARGLVERTFTDIVSARQVYDQLRIVATSGRELMRVDLVDDHGSVKPQAALSDKKSRYYVQESLSLKEGQVYISRLDLNVENGVLEQPIKPMLRVVAGIHDEGRLQGLLVINYRASHLLESIRRSAHEASGSDIWLLNKQGYWLHSSDPAQAWGFMYEDRLLDNVPTQYPELWQSIAESGNQVGRQVQVGGFVYTWDWVDFSEILLGSGVARSSGDLLYSREADGWWVVTRIPVAEHAFTITGYLQRHWRLQTGFLAALLLLTLLVDRAWVNARLERLNNARSSRRFEDLTNRHRIGVFSLIDGRIRRANQAFADILRVSGSEAVNGMTLADLGFPAEALEEVRSGVAGQQEVDLEALRLVRPNGSVLWLTLSFKPQPGVSGVYDFVVEDITEEKIRRDREQEHQHQLEMAGELSAIGYWTLDVETEALSWSSAMYHIHGRREGDFRLSYTTAVECILPDQRDALRASIERSIATGEAFAEHLTIVRPDGEHREVVVHAIGEPGVGGAIERVFGVYQDVTDISEQERELREIEARLRTVLDTINDAVVTIDNQGVIRQFSGGAEKMFGHMSEYAVGRNVSLLMPPEVARDHDDFLRRYREGNRSGFVGGGLREMLGQKADGSVFPIEITLGTSDLEGEPLVVGVMRDLSERKKTEEQLFQAQKMEAVGKLTGGVAHDFNNILTVILGNIQLAARKATDGDYVKGKLSTAENATKIGADLTRRLLAYSRQQDLEFETVDVNALLGDLNNMLLRTIGEDIELDFHLDTTSCYALVDKNQLETALLNLVVNARDALAGPGKIKVETSHVVLSEQYAAARTEVVPGEYILLSVSDNGPGIPKDIQDSIFEPFFTTKEVGKGTGLGLSMVYGFVKQSSGHIDVYSESDLGTTFKIYLPVAEEARVDKPSQEPTESEGGSETILVVEDEHDVREVSVSILMDLGYTVLEAANGPEALAILDSQTHIDLLFTDIIMPGGMRGTDVAKEARGRRPGIRVLFTSGYTERAFQASDVEFAHEMLLSKPFNFESLAEKIRLALDHPTKKIS